MQLHHFFIDFSKLDSFSIWMDLKKNDAGSRLSHSLSLALGERTHPIYRYRRLKTFLVKCTSKTVLFIKLFREARLTQKPNRS